MSDQPASSVLLSLSTGLAALVHDVAPSLVSIQSARSRLSGFSWRPGLIVAAENALPDDDEHSIVAHDGASTPARVVGRDPSTDVALLRLERNDLPKASSAAAAPTTGALAVVTGAREGAATAALGVVSFVGPQWRSLRGGVIDARIELDAALARSSEGGLALDASGQALGMAVFGPRRRTLVIPMTTIDRVADVLATKGRIARGYLGLGLQPVKLDAGGMGAMATSVDAKGPGAAAGVRQGDIIVAWNGEPIRGVDQLVRALGPDSVGASVRLTLRRAGEPIEATLMIGERPESQ
ncbi:MAG TPA: S1C family serine protease [Roseiarcus sp.]|jgi:S1-C subfamily serine protease|nr:S1C family serine protease [Roseiarcus sp.]